MEEEIVFLNARTCGIYKNGAPRYRTDPSTGKRTDQIDNELIEAVHSFVAGTASAAESRVPLSEVYRRRVLVPTYYDSRYGDGIIKLLADLSVEGVTLGELLDRDTIKVRGGHGSPGNDQRTGHIPYVKVSDIRGLRVNVNPTNLVSESVASRFWRRDSSGLEAWDVITPNRASSNIGEFAILLPGEEQIVLTKEVFVLRLLEHDPWDPFYLLWALSLQAVRDQWRRIALMQTNREDCGSRYREIIVPKPPSGAWAREKSAAFREYFTTLAGARDRLVRSVSSDGLAYIASVVSALPLGGEEADSDVGGDEA